MFQKDRSRSGLRRFRAEEEPDRGREGIAETEAVAILNHNQVVAYVVSPAVWEYVQELHDDAMIVEELETMDREEPIRVNIDETMSSTSSPRL